MGVSENVKRPGRNPTVGKFTSRYPLLIERAKLYGFDIPTGAPMGARVTVWRLPPIDYDPTSKLWVPLNAQSPNVIGVLVAAGMSALDYLESNGCTLGHHVKFERFAGWEHDDQTPEHKRGSRFLHINDRQILESLDLMNDLEAGRVNYLRGDDGRNRLEVKLLSGKKAKVLRLAADPSATPAERKTAARIAAKLK
jgi:hypothetical protein